MNDNTTSQGVEIAPDRLWLEVCDEPECRAVGRCEHYDRDMSLFLESTTVKSDSAIEYIRADLPLFGPPTPYSPGDELQADVVLAILTLGACTCAAEIVTRESIKRYEGSVSHYCVPTRRLTR